MGPPPDGVTAPEPDPERPELPERPEDLPSLGLAGDAPRSREPANADTAKSAEAPPGSAEEPIKQAAAALETGEPPCLDQPPVAAVPPTLEDPAPPAPTDPVPIPIPPVVDVHDLDWTAIGHAADPPAIRARMRSIVEGMEALLDRADRPGMLFDGDRSGPEDRAIQVKGTNAADPMWIIGDLHGDLLALETALAVIRVNSVEVGQNPPRMVFLGDLFDDEGFGLELVLRVFELILEGPEQVCVLAGNHDEALSYDGVRFAAGVSPADFADFLNDNLAHEWIERAGKLVVRFFANAPRALFFPDGLLLAHGGFPLADLHGRLAETGDWNDPSCLSDFVWTRAHPTARRKLPNRYSRGSQFGYGDFAAFCELSTRLGRPVTHMVRGHDHVEERYAFYPAYRAHPVLTTVALSRRLPRESFGPALRVPTLARVVEFSQAQVHRMHIPADLIHGSYPGLAKPESSEDTAAADEEVGA